MPKEASADIHTGSLAYSNDVSYGFTALANSASTGWRNFSELTWTVSNEQAGAPEGFDWFYRYTIMAEKFAPVRWFIETGGGFSGDHIDLASAKVYDDGVLVAYDTANISFGTFASTGDSGDRRSMPDERHGMFWADTSPGGQNTSYTTISFWSSAAPMWGDLYSNCGGNGNRGWNSGFLDDNPIAAASSGTIGNHVLVPGVIPEPAAIGLLGLAGIVALVGRRFIDPSLRR